MSSSVILPHSYTVIAGLMANGEGAAASRLVIHAMRNGQDLISGPRAALMWAWPAHHLENLLGVLPDLERHSARQNFVNN
jgi:hypothetical protein